MPMPPPPLLDPSLAPLFWDSLLPTTQSAWHGHVPFAHWLVAACRPRVLVELGTHAGVSYAAFCQAVQRCGLPTVCTAIDSWAGDDHAGAYSEDVYATLKAFHDPRFAGFSRLLRTTFDAAAGDVADGSIDLLHIDGFHSYEAVSHDFQTWRPKLSDRAVVLFHDTNVRVRDFGVWRFWEEIRDSGIGSLEFLHAFGLGVLLVGPNAPDSLRDLCAAPPDDIRRIFAAAGQRHVLEYDRAHTPAAVPDAPPVTRPPPMDASLDPGQIHIAERFAAPAGLHAVRLPRDAVTRSQARCAVWITSLDGSDWRQGCIAADPMADPQADTVTLVFAPFTHPGLQHFHLFVTDACAPGALLPAKFADLLAQRRPPIALDTPILNLSGLPPHGLFRLGDLKPAGRPA